jgi:hypothetical protein
MYPVIDDAVITKFLRYRVTNINYLRIIEEEKQRIHNILEKRMNIPMSQIRQDIDALFYGTNGVFMDKFVITKSVRYFLNTKPEESFMYTILSSKEDEQTRVIATLDIPRGTLVYKGEASIAVEEHNPDPYIYANLAMELKLDLWNNRLADLYPIQNDEMTKINRLHNVLKYNSYVYGNCRYLFLGASYFTNSCIPNCYYHIEAGVIYIYTHSDIPTGQILTVSKCGMVSDNVAARQKYHLIAGYLCKCNACLSQKNIQPMNYMSAEALSSINYCFWCTTPFVAIICAKCHVAKYCCGLCQYTHNKYHKKQCKNWESWVNSKSVVEIN